MKRFTEVADADAQVSEIAIPARDILHVSPEDSLENVR